MTDDAESRCCTGFEPQNILQDRCKKCFSVRSNHKESRPKIDSSNAVITIQDNNVEGTDPCTSSNGPNMYCTSNVKSKKYDSSAKQQQSEIPIPERQESCSNNINSKSKAVPTKRRKISTKKEKENDEYLRPKIIAKHSISAEKLSKEQMPNNANQGPASYRAVEIQPSSSSSSNNSSPTRIHTTSSSDKANEAETSTGIKEIIPPEENTLSDCIAENYPQLEKTESSSTLQNDDEEQAPGVLLLSSSSAEHKQSSNTSDGVKQTNRSTITTLQQQRSISFTSSSTNSPLQSPIQNASFLNSLQNSPTLVTYQGQSFLKFKKVDIDDLPDIHGNGQEADENYDLSTTDSVSLASYKTANSKLSGLTSGMVPAKSIESMSSVNLDSLMSTSIVSPDEFNDEFELALMDRAMTPTGTTEFAHLELAQLRMENGRLLEQCRRLKKERSDWIVKLRKRGIKLTRREGRGGECDSNSQEVLAAMEEKMNELENLVAEYREENSTLKCELKQIQNIDAVAAITNKIMGGQELAVKFKDLESTCEKLTEENERMKREVYDLQQEMQEMQDQYREEEIDEFREMQRELEQNAKNCRILQFKLRKSERQREQIQMERNVLVNKVRRKRQTTDEAEDDSVGGEGRSAEDVAGDAELSIDEDPIVGRRIKELESELRIAKEVSVRLHNELETSEDKRYKLEDDVFYYKEKVRELQKLQKWREARNNVNKFQLDSNKESLNSTDDMVKELRDVLEREADLRDQLRFTEDDLKRTRSRLSELENENEEMLDKCTKMYDCQSPINTTLGMCAIDRPPMTRSVSDGDRQPNSLKILGDVYNRTAKIKAKASSAQQHQEDERAVNATRVLEVELRNERQERKELAKMVDYYKQFIAVSGDQKLLTLNKKMESLNNQLKLQKERFDILHLRELKSTTQTNYLIELKNYCEELEKRLSELRAEQEFKATSAAPKDTNNNQRESATKLPASSEDIEQCCIMLASVEAQTSRIFKQLEKLDGVQNVERRRSLNKEGIHYASLVLDLSNVLTELRVLHQLLDAKKILNRSESASESSMITVISANKDSNSNIFLTPPTSVSHCVDCARNESTSNDLRDELQFYKKKNKELTNQILQMDTYWRTEIDRREEDVKSLESEIKRHAEQMELAKSNSALLSERSQLVSELKIQLSGANIEIDKRNQKIKGLEQTQKKLKEWEIKHNKLEEMFEREREKFERERERYKAEIFELKKRGDEAIIELGKLRDDKKRLEGRWTEEKARLETELTTLHAKITDSIDETSLLTPINTIRYESNSERDNTTNTRMDESRRLDVEHKLTLLEKEKTEMNTQINNLRAFKTQAELELAKSRLSWTREKEALVHKQRQEQKLKTSELESLRTKFNSRMEIMENTNKMLNAQLLQIRRERDSQSEMLGSYKYCLLKCDHNQMQKSDKAKDSIMEGLHNCEITRLNAQINDLRKDISSKEYTFKQKLKELNDQLKLLEDDQRNLVEISQIAQNQLQTEQDKLHQIIRHVESQLSSLSQQDEKHTENEMIIENAVSQLSSLKREDERPLRFGTFFEAPMNDLNQIQKPQKSASMNQITLPISHKFNVTDSQNYVMANSCFQLTRNKIDWENNRELTKPSARSVSPIKQNRIEPIIPVYSKGLLDQNNGSFISAQNIGYYQHQRVGSDLEKGAFGDLSNGENDTFFTHYSWDPRRRMSTSAGTNILCKIRREEQQYSDGSRPTVKKLAQAFESLGRQQKRQKPRIKKTNVAHFLGLKKSHSIDTDNSNNNHQGTNAQFLFPTSNHARRISGNQSGSVQSINSALFDASCSLATNDSSIENSHQQLQSMTLPRGSRNPFKGIGTKLVEKVRRSLSRSSKERNRSMSYDEGTKAIECENHQAGVLAHIEAIESAHTCASVDKAEKPPLGPKSLENCEKGPKTKVKKKRKSEIPKQKEN